MNKIDVMCLGLLQLFIFILIYILLMLDETCVKFLHYNWLLMCMRMSQIVPKCAMAGVRKYNWKV